jgi:hypothetical protein
MSNNRLEQDIHRVAAGGDVEKADNHPADCMSLTDRREMYEWFVELLAKIPTCPKCGSDTCRENTQIYLQRAYKILVGPTSVLVMLMALLDRIGPNVRLSGDEIRKVNEHPDWAINHVVNHASGEMEVSLAKPGPSEPNEDFWPNVLEDKEKE